MERRAHSPIPAPREPRRDRMMPEPYGRHEEVRRPMRRQRSISPEMYGRRRQPSPGRYKRHRPAEYEYDEYRYDRRSPPRRSPEYEQRQGYAPHPGQGKDPPPPPRGPKSFKTWFMEQEDGMSPEEAQVAYDAYLAKHFGSELRAAFERNKDKLVTRESFDPNMFAEALEARRAAAAEEAVQLTNAIADSTYDPASDTFYQGTLQEEAVPAAAEPPKQPKQPKQVGGSGQGGEVGGPPPPPPVSPLLWKPERVVADLKLARKLMVVLDAERGLTANPLLEADLMAAAAAADAAAAAEGEEGAAGAGKDEAAAAEDGEAAAAATEDKADGEAAAATEGDGSAAAVAGGDKRLAAVLAAIDASQVDVEGEAALEVTLGQLDLALTWLWRVHGVDYYAGRELVKPSEYNARLAKQRTLRGPKPEEGEEMDEADAKRDMERLATAVDERWQKRLTDGDPLKKGAQQEEIQRRMDAWVESQIVKISDNKWGNHLSNKFFLEKKFVVKHITNKHPEKVEEARKELVNELYWEAYKTHHESNRALVVTKRSAARVENAHARAEGMDYEDGRGRRQGRPMHSKIRPPGGMEMPLMMDPAAAGGAMLVPAGMGPMGPIFIPAGPMAPMMPQLAPMDIDMSGMMAGGMMPMMGGGRGGRGGRGRPMGRGGRGMMAAPGAKLDAGGVREYYDLDAPRNNRAVLDYGDI